jgi:hypothetical protein
LFASLHLLYFANVRLLPGHHYLQVGSLALDAVLLALVFGPVVVIVRSTRLRAARLEWGRQVAAGGAVLFVACAFALVMGWPRSPRDPVRSGSGPNLLLVVVDSARRDRVGIAGRPEAASPSTRHLARDGRVYEAAFAASSWTVPSVARMLGQDSHEAPSASSLAGRLKSRGYVTACFTDNPHLTAGSTLTRDFDRVERSVGRWRRLLARTTMGQVVERVLPGNDRHLVDRALTWAGSVAGPTFLYVHLMDSHTPYRHPPIDGKRRPGRRIEFPFPGMEMTTLEAEDVIARYDGGVRSADEQVGRLVASARSGTRPWLAIITADHGESLGEDGRWFHGQSLAPELLAIPLVVVGEGVRSARVTTPVGHDAIYRTLLTAAGLACDGCSGPDLRFEEGDGVVDGGLPPMLRYRIAAGYKLVVNAESGKRRLFALHGDPDDREDLAAQLPQLIDRLAAGLSSPRGGVHVPPEELERVRSLGYLGSGQ